MEESKSLILTATIAINPDQDTVVQELYRQGCELRDYALARTITCLEEAKVATDDLAVIANNKKDIEECKKRYVGPIRQHLDDVNQAFKDLTAPLLEADVTNKLKVKLFHEEQERRRSEAEDINRQKVELAQKEAALNDGEITIDTTPVEVPLAPAITHSGLGSAGMAKIWKFEVVDFSLVPDEYKMVDATKLGKVVRAGLRIIPGIRIFEESTVRVTPRRG